VPAVAGRRSLRRHRSRRRPGRPGARQCQQRTAPSGVQRSPPGQRSQPAATSRALPRPAPPAAGRPGGSSGVLRVEDERDLAAVGPRCAAHRPHRCHRHCSVRRSRRSPCPPPSVQYARSRPARRSAASSPPSRRHGWIDSRPVERATEGPASSPRTAPSAATPGHQPWLPGGIQHPSSAPGSRRGLRIPSGPYAGRGARRRQRRHPSRAACPRTPAPWPTREPAASGTSGSPPGRLPASRASPPSGSCHSAAGGVVVALAVRVEVPGVWR
jgi:hypothetical protein